ncbi:thiol reductase thioredoxin [Streptococcus didelphis]|uniref:Thiol reductase thioredoxin n=2 Tax=Streptococcus didelphis TaxID=102886 RepID=A0ABY9LIJ3_9STRE|nr:thiol reductase thioredoxin [Streptococcus didelphis]WMB28711.1 thiol reductase thioredoxin [Streptococcus didelphis]WMB29366.1 thiol reductase thioredoxin [Streptococcus didelphis]
MKKHLLFLLLILLSTNLFTKDVFAAGASKYSLQYTQEILNYQKELKSFKKISISDLQSKMNNEEEFYLYIGRGSCPHCRAFVPKLSEVVKQRNVTVYYLDTEHASMNEDIRAFRKNYNIVFVPNALKFSGLK